MNLHPAVALSLLSAIPLLAPSAHAIKGTYLPEAELSRSTCKIQVGRAITIYTPSMQNGAPTGERPFTDEMHNVSMCSSTLVAPDTIFTAAHCFVGNNEQMISKGTFKYPKMDAQGNLLPGCEPGTWAQKPECIAGKMFGTVRSKWEDLTLICPTNDGRTESRPLIEATGYPNPLFRADASAEQITLRNYDFAIWRVEQPFLNTPVMPVETDPDRLIATLKTSARSCRSFGYGRDNDEKSGILHGARTPITAANQRVLISDLAPTDDGPFVDGGRVDHGDSGGTLTCQNPAGETRLFGIISRGGEDFAPMSTYRAELSIYSTPAYNASWIRHVMENGPVRRDTSTKWWYEFTVKYHQQALETSLRAAKSCIDENRREMGREVYRNHYLPAYNDLTAKYAAAQKEARQYSNDAGLLRAHMREILDLSSRLLMACQTHDF
jgi:hypothetical protein